MSTPTETSPTQRHVDEVVESLERASTLLKRRTRDVLKLAREREELLAAIENRPSRVAPAPVEPEGGTAIHGVSSAPHPGGDAPEFENSGATATVPDVEEPSTATASPEIGAATADPAVDSPLRPDADHEHARTDHPEPEQQPSPEFAAEPPAAPAESGVAGKWGQRAPVQDDHPEVIDAAEAEAETTEFEATQADAPRFDTTEFEATEAGSMSTTPEDGAGYRDDTPAQPAEPSVIDDRHDFQESGDFEERREQATSPTPAWEKPDLEWSDDAPHVAPREFPHPMPPVGSDDVATAWDDEAEAPAGPTSQTWEEPARDLSYDAPVRSAGAIDDSPFATEFEEHVEEVGGSLEPSPFDLDTPPQPSSYRPRSLQSDRDRDSVPASSLLEERAETVGGEDRPVERVEAAWDDFAGDGGTGSVEHPEDPAAPSATFESSEPAPATSGSRLRDLVAQAREAEQTRTEQQKSDFDLINEDATVSRYDKNSAKLPTVGISSEELSSSVASLRSSFTNDKKSGSSDGGGRGGSSRSDKKAEKRAAKEAAKAAKAEAKRSRKQRD